MGYREPWNHDKAAEAPAFANLNVVGVEERVIKGTRKSYGRYSENNIFWYPNKINNWFPANKIMWKQIYRNFINTMPYNSHYMYLQRVGLWFDRNSTDFGADKSGLPSYLWKFLAIKFADYMSSLLLVFFLLKFDAGVYFWFRWAQFSLWSYRVKIFWRCL